MALEDEMDEEIAAAIDAPLLERRIANLERQLAEEQAERANFRAGIAGALHVSGASEGTLVDFVARLYTHAAESEAQCARMREALTRLLPVAGAWSGNWEWDDSDTHAVNEGGEALSSTAGADLLREVTALRYLESVAISHDRDGCSKGCEMCRALAAVADARRKP